MTRAEAVDRLLSEYAQTRREDERDRDRRVREARAADPEIARLMDENARLFEENTRRMLENWQDAAALSRDMRAKLMENQTRIKARLALSGFPEDQMEMRFHCAQCRDTGYAGEMRARFCSCFQQRLLTALFEGSNMTGLEYQNFDAFNEAIYPDEEQRLQAVNARNICRRYADSFPRTERLNLLLMGESGLGKTFLLNSVAERVLARGMVALRVTGFRMLEAMREYHFGQAGEDGGALEKILSAELLLIDDLGSEPMLRNITVEYLFLLLNERIAARRHTLVATNLTITELQERYGERVMSRLMDRANSAFIRLSGRDLRYVDRRNTQ